MNREVGRLMQSKKAVRSDPFADHVASSEISYSSRTWKGPALVSEQLTRPAGEFASEQTPGVSTRRKPGPRPGTEAAKRGGTAARDKYGKEFYSRIGAKGGSMVRERHGSTFYTEIGRRGGEATKRNLGTEHYSRIGRIGGQRAHNRNSEGEGETSTKHSR
jgi:hypothetical protein